ncbi:MAG: hypothetical protein ACJ77A_03615 [Actinomycetota bacterium]
MRTRRIAGGGAAVLVLSVALVLVPAGVASAHEERDVGPYAVAVGFGDEPAYAGIENSVQMFIHTKKDKPVVDLGPTLNVQVSYGNRTMGKLTMEPDFEVGEFGIPGDYRAFFVPTRPGDYTFHFTGTIKGTPVNESFASGPTTFSSVDDPSSVEFPVKDPTAGELGDAVRRLQPRVDGAVAAQQRLTTENRALRDDADSAKSLATVALIVGAALGLIGIGVGLAGLAAGRRARRGPAPDAARG